MGFVVSLAHSKLTFEVFKLLPEYLCSSAGQMESNRGLGTSLNGKQESPILSAIRSLWFAAFEKMLCCFTLL